MTDITVVPEQRDPDGDFPTCPYPNPEIREAMQKGIDLCQEVKPDLLLATDPDATVWAWPAPMATTTRC